MGPVAVKITSLTIDGEPYPYPVEPPVIDENMKEHRILPLVWKQPICGSFTTPIVSIPPRYTRRIKSKKRRIRKKSQRVKQSQDFWISIRKEKSEMHRLASMITELLKEKDHGDGKGRPQHSLCGQPSM